MKTIISLDIGTTVVKTVAFSLLGEELSVFEQPLSLLYPQEGYVEQNPQELLRACEVVLKYAFDSVDKDEISALSMSTQGGSLVPADVNGIATGNLVTWMDARAEDLVETWDKTGVSEQLRQDCGWRPQAGLPLPLIHWFKKYDQELYKRTIRWMSVNDFVVHHLTGEFVSNLSCASEMLLVDLATDNWSDAISSMAGIDKSFLSDIRESTCIVGPLCDEMMTYLGIRKMLPVINGGQDHSCEALALGVKEKGMGMLACGTAWVLNVALHDKNMDLVPDTMDLNYHVIPDTYIASEFLGCYGKHIEWWVSEIAGGLVAGCDRDALYKKFNNRIKKAKLGSAGAIYDARGGRFLGIGPAQDFGDLSRALIEGLVYQVYYSVNRLANMGVPLKELWLIGGASRNALLPQMIADSLGITVRMTSYTHGPALGAAMLAMLATGEATSFEEARMRFKRDDLCLYPAATKYGMYQRLYEKHKEINKDE